MAMLVTQVATAAAALALDGDRMDSCTASRRCSASPPARSPAWSRSRRPRAAAARSARWRSALAAGVLCFLASSRLKRRLGYDDALDVFGVHGVGGIVGALLTGVFASAALGGIGLAEGVGIGAQVGKQALAVLVTCAWSGAVTAGVAVADRPIHRAARRRSRARPTASTSPCTTSAATTCNLSAHRTRGCPQ